MKIRDLIKQTGVPRQTIHYYIQTGLLPKPRKTGRNSAEYNETHLDYIRLIRELQDNYFLPLPVIKKILKKHGRTPADRSELKFQRDFFKPVEQLLAGEITGEEAFMEATGIIPERLADYESWGIITPTIQNGRKVYSYDDQIIGKVIAQWRALGLTSSRGFSSDIIRSFHDMFKEIVVIGNRFYLEAASRTMSKEEILGQSNVLLETTALFFYRLYRKLAKEDFTSAMESSTDPAGPEIEKSSGEAGPKNIEPEDIRVTGSTD